MTSCRSRIHNIRDYEKFLRARGFSRSEARILARSYRDLASLAGIGKDQGSPQV